MRRTIKQNEALTHPLLPSAKYWMLLVLADGRELHGYGIKQTIRENTRGMIDLDVGSTYGYIKHLKQAGLIYESDYREDEEGNPRRHYRLTDLGGQALRADQQRIREMAGSSPEHFGEAFRRRIFWRAFAIRTLSVLPAIVFLLTPALLYRLLRGIRPNQTDLVATLFPKIYLAFICLMMVSIVALLALAWDRARRRAAVELALNIERMERALNDKQVGQIR